MEIKLKLNNKKIKIPNNIKTPKEMADSIKEPFREIVICCQGADYLPIENFNEFQGDLKSSPDDNIVELMKQILIHGWASPVFLWKNPKDDDLYLLDGHGRLMASLAFKEAGWTLPMVPVVFVDADDEKEAAEILLAINSNYNEMSQKGLESFVEKFEIPNVSMDGFKLSGVQIDMSVFDEEEEENIEDEIPELDEDEPTTTKEGDLWELGNNRLFCGDSTKKEHVEKLLNNIQPHLMVTDPPYGVKYDPEWRDGADLGVGERSKGKVQNDDNPEWTETYKLFPGQIAYVWHAGVFAATVQRNLEEAGFKIRNQIIWTKQHFVMSRGDYHWQHEPCWYGVRGKGNWTGDRKQTTVWKIKNNNSFGNSDVEETVGHGTQKPVECMRRPILNNSSPGQVIYDPFLGSGTTIIAAEDTGRMCYGMEIDPFYCDVIVQRYKNWCLANDIKPIIKLNGKRKNKI